MCAPLARGVQMPRQLLLYIRGVPGLHPEIFAKIGATQRSWHQG
jgi:hypothetical protein